jgi:hypothetical protein
MQLNEATLKSVHDFFLSLKLWSSYLPFIFKRKVYRRILGPVYDNEKENWMILTNKEIYARVKILL